MKLTIDLPEDVAEFVQRQLAKGSFPDAGSLAVEALRSYDEQTTLREDPTATEGDRLLREVVVPIYDAMKADPSRALTHEQMLEAAAEWDREDAMSDEPSGYLKRTA